MRFFTCGLVATVLVVVGLSSVGVGASPADAVGAGGMLQGNPIGEVADISNPGTHTGRSEPSSQTVEIGHPGETVIENGTCSFTLEFIGENIEAIIDREGNDNYNQYVQLKTPATPELGYAAIVLMVDFWNVEDTDYQVDWSSEMNEAEVTFKGHLAALPLPAPKKNGSTATNQIDFWVRGFANSFSSLPARQKLDPNWMETLWNNSLPISKSGTHTGSWADQYFLGAQSGSGLRSNTAFVGVEVEQYQSVLTDSGDGTTKTISKTTEYKISGWQFHVSVTELP